MNELKGARAYFFVRPPHMQHCPLTSELVILTHVDEQVPADVVPPSFKLRVGSRDTVDPVLLKAR